MKKEKAKKIENTVKSIWDSLQSHFPYIYSGKDKNFHIKTIKEVEMTKYDFSKSYNIHGKHIRDLMRKARESFRGWVFIPS